MLDLMNFLIWAREVQLPEQFLLPVSSNLRKTVQQSHFDRSALHAQVGSLFHKNQRCGAENLVALEDLGARIREEFGVETEDAVLAGDGAVLAGLYHDPDAFTAANWAALLKDGTYTNGSKPRSFGAPVEDWSEKVEFGGMRWRKPKPALLISLLSAHVGDPAAPPTPFMWPHLGLALLVWKDRVTVGEICKVGEKLGRPEEVARGLLVAAQIFTELVEWLEGEKLGIPAWERKFAMPLAARRLMIGERA
jgi:hypothetical protein